MNLAQKQKQWQKHVCIQFVSLVWYQNNGCCEKHYIEIHVDKIVNCVLDEKTNGALLRTVMLSLRWRFSLMSRVDKYEFKRLQSLVTLSIN